MIFLKGVLSAPFKKNHPQIKQCLVFFANAERTAEARMAAKHRTVDRQADEDGGANPIALRSPQAFDPAGEDSQDSPHL